MNLYVYKGKEHKGLFGEALVKKALAHYTDRKYKNPIIKREEHGKPFFKDIPVFFSISHSGDIWVCLMADFNVGIDIQISKNLNYNKLSERFFHEYEIEYIKQFGEEAFFEIWTRKEALVKYTGKGFANQNFSSFSVVNKKNKEYLFKNILDDVFFENIDLPLKNETKQEKIYISMCVKNREPLIIKEI